MTKSPKSPKLPKHSWTLWQQGSGKSPLEYAAQIYEYRNLSREVYKSLRSDPPSSKDRAALNNYHTLQLFVSGAKAQGVWIPSPNKQFKTWYPLPVEVRPCCQEMELIRPEYGWALHKHCRTLKHVAMLFDVEEKDLRKELGINKPTPKRCENCSRFASPDSPYCGYCLTTKCAECTRPRVNKDYLCKTCRQLLDNLEPSC